MCSVVVVIAVLTAVFSGVVSPAPVDSVYGNDLRLLSHEPSKTATKSIRVSSPSVATSHLRTPKLFSEKPHEAEVAMDKISASTFTKSSLHFQHDHVSQPSFNHSSSLRFHNTDELMSKLLAIASACPHADPEWTTVATFPPPTRSFPNGWTGIWNHWMKRTFLQGQKRGIEPNVKLSPSYVLVITITRDAKFRNAARRAGLKVHPRPAVVVTFGEHGRERVTSELALRILLNYCSSFSASVPVGDLDNEIVLIPIVNEQGRRTVEQGHDCWRLNGRSVDLNRNYRTQWGMHDLTTVLEEEACGRAPLSEFETRAVDAIVARFSPLAYISVHSGDSAIVVPWDSHADGVPASNLILSAAEHIARIHCAGCPVGSAASLFGYQAYGTGVDHMLSVRGVPLALTIEIWRGDDKFCQDMFNPLTRASLESVFFNWSGIVQTTLSIITGKDDVGFPFFTPRLAGVALDNDRLEVMTSADRGQNNYVVHWTLASKNLHNTNAAQMPFVRPSGPSSVRESSIAPLRRTLAFLLPMGIAAIGKFTIARGRIRRKGGLCRSRLGFRKNPINRSR